jgi:GT2 family glycosyltransferase
MIDISVCLITYNKLPFLKRSINSFVQSIDSAFKVQFLTWDNGSTDGTGKYLKSISMPDNVEHEHHWSNINVGLNAYGLLAKHATGKIIVTMDDDIFKIEPAGWERRFVKVFESTFNGKRFGYVGTDTINKDGGRDYNSWGLAVIDDLRIDVGLVGGWFTATTPSVYNEVGGFHIGKPEMHLEDADYQNRVWQKGYLCGTLLNTRVLHARSPSYYEELGCVETYREKARLATRAGIILEPLT